jgi:hypothetical protein
MAGPGEASKNLTVWLALGRTDDPLVNHGSDLTHKGSSGTTGRNPENVRVGAAEGLLSHRYAFLNESRRIFRVHQN